MKKLLFIVSCFILISSGCKKNKQLSELSKLPAETQTGANTFGCLVNGKAFLPKGSIFSGPNLSCYYQHIYFSSPKGFVFQVAARDKSNGCQISSVIIGGDSIVINEGEIYNFSSESKGNFIGAYLYFPSCTSSEIRYITTPNTNGQLTIKKFDPANQIISGTFWFNAVNSLGDTVKVTDGRFDMHYTR